MSKSTSQTRELEAKFKLLAPHNAHIQAELTQPQPPQFLEGYTRLALGTITQTDTYLDTPIYDLLRHGLTMRVRHNGTAYEVGIKGIQTTRKKSIQERIDIIIPLPPETPPFDPAAWPETVAEQLAPYHVTLDKIEKVLVIHQRREKTHFLQAESNTPFAELSIDEVWVVAGIDDKDASAEHFGAAVPSAQASGESTSIEDSSHFWELEIELLHSSAPAGDGSIAQQNEVDKLAFIELVQKLQKNYNLTPVYESKFLRGLNATIAQAHGGQTTLAPTQSLEAAGRLLLHQQLSAILLNEHGVRYGKKAKYVHDMRVAIRRARTALQFCENSFPAKEVARQQKALKRLGKALGAVRDLDVALANLNTFRRNQPPHLHKGIKLLRSELAMRRANAQVHLWALLESKKHAKFIRRLHKFCITPSPQGKPEPDAIECVPIQVRHTLPSIILRAFESVRAYEVALNASERPPLETFHALRIRAKYLRYLLEFANPLLGDEGKRVIIQLRDIQEHLGQLNDAHVEQERLNAWFEKLQSEPQLVEAINTRLELVTQRIEELAATAPASLNRFITLQNRHLLANALANI